MPDPDSRSERYVTVTPMSAESLAAFNGPPSPDIYCPGRSPFALVRVDEHENVTFTNNAADGYLARASGELEGCAASDIFGRERLADVGERWRKCSIRLPDGSLRAFEVQVMPMRRGAWVHLRLPTSTAA